MANPIIDYLVVYIHLDFITKVIEGNKGKAGEEHGLNFESNNKIWYAGTDSYSNCKLAKAAPKKQPVILSASLSP